MSNLIYLHENKINHKKYVGRTSEIENPNIRWQNGYGYSNQPFFEDIVKFGWDNFEHYILESNIEDDKIEERENYWIDYFDSMNPDKGYNARKGSSLSQKTIEKMKESWKNDERKQQQKELMIHLNKTIDRTGENNPMYQKNRSGKNAGRKRKVMCIETGDIFETLTDASNWCNPNGSNLRSHIAAQINGKRKSCGKHPETQQPLHWKYID